MKMNQKLLPFSAGFAGFLAVCGIFGLGGCSSPESLPDYEQRAPESARISSNMRRVSIDRPRQVGKVSLINTGDNFVLIELQSALVPKPGQRLYVYDGQMKSAELQVSKEKRRPFIIADIQEGLPQQEDLVYLPPTKPQTTGARPGSGGSTSASGGGGPYGPDPDLPADDGRPVPELNLLGADEEPDYSGEDGVLDDSDFDTEIDPNAPAPLLDPAP